MIKNILWSAWWLDIRLITNMDQRNHSFQAPDMFSCMNDSLEIGPLKAVPGGEVSTRHGKHNVMH